MNRLYDKFTTSKSDHDALDNAAALYDQLYSSLLRSFESAEVKPLAKQALSTVYEQRIGNSATFVVKIFSEEYSKDEIVSAALAAHRAEKVMLPNLPRLRAWSLEDRVLMYPKLEGLPLPEAELRYDLIGGEQIRSVHSQMTIGVLAGLEYDPHPSNLLVSPSGVLSVVDTSFVPESQRGDMPGTSEASDMARRELFGFIDVDNEEHYRLFRGLIDSALL